MRSSHLATLVVTGAMSVLVIALSGCGTRSAPTSSEPQVAVPETGSAVISANVTWDNAPEPPVHRIGGTPPADLTDEPRYGGTLIHGASGWTRFDPHFSAGIATERWFARLYAEGLLEWDLKCNCPKPELAESWKQVDDVTFDFTIRKGVKFHNLPPVNGRELTVQDAKWSLDRISGLGGRLKGVTSVSYAKYANVKEFKILDESTLRMVLNQPDSMILRELMYDYTVILPKEAAVEEKFMEQKTLIGTGPFIVELAENTGQSRFKKNLTYWKKDAKGRQLPYLDGVYTLGAGDPSAIQVALKTGQGHWVLLNTVALAKPFANDPQFRKYNTAYSMVGTTGFWMNVTKKPFDDVRVRRAINLAIDRWELGDAVYGPGGYYNTTFLGTWEPFTWSPEKLASMPGYAKTGPAKDKEVEEAKKLLVEAGYPNGFEFTCECEDVNKAEVLVEQMKRLGVKVNVHKVTSTDMRWTTYMRDKQFANANIGGGHTPDYSLTQYFLCDAATNLALVCDPKIEAWFKEFRASYDEKKQVEILQKVQDYLWDLMPIAIDQRRIATHLSYTWVRGWRNPMYECCWAHGNNVTYTWLDK